MKNPPHPGDLIKTEIIEALGLSVSKAAEILKVRRATLSDLLHGKAALTPEMALRIEKAFGPDMDHLLRVQLAYHVAQTREHARGLSIKRYLPAQSPGRAATLRSVATSAPKLSSAPPTPHKNSSGPISPLPISLEYLIIELEFGADPRLRVYSIPIGRGDAHRQMYRHFIERTFIMRYLKF